MGALLELLALAGLAITQPILDTFARSPETFVLRRADTSDIVLFTLAVAFVPGIGVWFVSALTGFNAPRWRKAGHLVAIGVMASLVVVQVLRRLTGLSGPLLVVSALAGGAAIAVLRSRSSGLGGWLRLLAIFPLALVVWFLGLSPVSDVAFGGETIGGDGIRIGAPADVLFIVFDELPTASLLAADGGINAEVFPAFAELAGDSTWYRNHSGAGPSTPQAVPAILTGTWPEDATALPVSDTYPQNLFSLLGMGYQQNSWEIGTDICPTALCPDEDATILARPLTELVGDAWSVLVEQLDERNEVAVVDFQIRQSEPQAPLRFDRFITSLEVPADGPRLDFLHILYPHQPWLHIPDGRRYEAPFIAEGLETGYRWRNQEIADQARQRHLLQLGHADRLLGEVIDRLRGLDRYDDTLIVVTADHGVAFLPGEPIRGLSEGNWEQIMWSPLLIKVPGRSQGVVDDQPATAVDVIPTLVDLLDIRFDPVEAAEWFFDGRELGTDTGTSLDRDDVRHHLPWKLNELEPDDGERWNEFDGVEGFARLLDRIDPAGAIGGEDLALWRFGRWGHLVGTDVAALPRQPTSMTGSVQDLDQWSDVVTLIDELPLWLGGSIRSPADGAVDVLVAFNGKVSGWSQTWPDGGQQRFAIIAPPQHLIDGANRVEVFVIDDSSGDPELIPVDIDG